MPAAEFKFKKGALMYRNCFRVASNAIAGLYHKKDIILYVIIADFVIPEVQEMENI
jgi:hypothetical protein